MTHFTKTASLISILLAALSGCGGSGSGGTASDPFSSSTGSGATTGSVLSYNMALTTTDSTSNSTTVGPSGTVIASAILKDNTGSPIANQTVTFASDPASPVAIPAVTATTDSNGKAVVFLSAPQTSTNVDVIFAASAVIGGIKVGSVSIFKILMSSGNLIKFVTSKAPTDPDGTLNTIAVEVQAVPTPAPGKVLLQLVPFEVLDLNNNPRSHTPVTVSIYSHIGCPDVYIDSPETVSKTVTTDDSGIGIFNIGIPLDMPAIGDKNACSIIYKATASDLRDPNATIYSYGGVIASIENKQL